MYAHIGRLAILHIFNVAYVHEREEEGMLLFPESGPKKDFRVGGRGGGMGSEGEGEGL